MTTAPRPNIIVFFVDQQRWDTLGVNGYPSGLTPNLDRMARRGTFFQEAVTPQPVCGPARSCLQTGQYATTTGVHTNGPGLKPDAPKLAEFFNDAGYHTAYFGKWHLSAGTGSGPVPKENRGGYQKWLGANAVEIVSGPYSSCLWDEDDQKVSLPGYRVDAQTDAMLDYLSERAQTPEEPFLCYQSYLEPHHQNTDGSYPAPDGYEDLYRYAPLPPDLVKLGGDGAEQWAGYCGMIKRLDEALGRTLDHLKSTGMDENTIVVYISDHGCHFRTRNAEFKRSPHESSVRVPMVFSGPGWTGGGEKHTPASLVDLMPTLLTCAGIAVPEAVEGQPLQAPPIHEEAFIQFGDKGLPPGRALRTSRWKYAVTADVDAKSKAEAPTYTETHLYDLRTDPYELRNLVSSEHHQPVCEAFRAKLLQRMADIGETDKEILPAESKASGQLRVDYPG